MGVRKGKVIRVERVSGKRVVTVSVETDKATGELYAPNLSVVDNEERFALDDTVELKFDLAAEPDVLNQMIDEERAAA